MYHDFEHLSFFIIAQRRAGGELNIYKVLLQLYAVLVLLYDVFHALHQVQIIIYSTYISKPTALVTHNVCLHMIKCVAQYIIQTITS